MIIIRVWDGDCVSTRRNRLESEIKQSIIVVPFSSIPHDEHEKSPVETERETADKSVQ